MRKFLALLALLAGTNSACEDVPPEITSQQPVFRMSIDVEGSSRDRFLEALSKVAARNQIEHEIAKVTPDGVYYIAEMLSDDFRIIVANDLEPEVFDLRAYESVRRPLPRQELDQFIAEIRDALRDFEGISVRPLKDP